jgi:nitrogen fixation protein FixH
MTRPLTGRAALFWLLAAFAIVFAVNAIFVAEAIGTFRGGDEQNPYLQGIDYNQTLARRAAQAALGWHATIGAQNGRIVVTLAARNGAPVTGESLQGELHHPSDANLDRAISFRAIAPGRYAADVSNVKPGAWDVFVRASDTKKPFEASRRLWLH